MYCMHKRGETERSGAYALLEHGSVRGAQPGWWEQGGGRPSEWGEAVVLIVLPRGQHRGRGAGVAVVGRLEAGVPIPVDPDTSGSSSDRISPQIPDRDSLTDSTFVVQPYPTRRQLVRSPAMDSPTQRHVEVVSDRFCMATSGVKRVGKGYQSCHVKPVSMGTPSSSSWSRSPGKFFHSSRRPMPPPVSSEDRRFAGSGVDELGRIQPGNIDADTCGRPQVWSVARSKCSLPGSGDGITHAWLTNPKANISCPPGGDSS